MSPHLRRRSRAPRRGGPARRAVLGLGLLIAGTAPGVASAAGPADPVPPVATGRPGQGSQGNTAPGAGTNGDNTPGTNKAGHANGGTGEGAAGVDPDRTPDLGTANQFGLTLARPDRVPGDLVLSGATFAFTPSTGNAPARTCTTDAAGTCTVTWWPRVTGDESVVVLPPGAYVVSQTRSAPGLAAVTGPIGRLDLCVLLCDGSRPIPVTNASLFRTQVIGTVADGAGRPVPGQQFSLAGQTYAGHPGDAYVAGAATSDADGTLVYDGWFAPGDWTFTPTPPDGSEPLPAQRRTLAPAPGGGAALEPWRVRLDREGPVTIPPPNPPGGGQGGSGAGNTDVGTPGSTGSGGSLGAGAGAGAGAEAGAGTGGSGTGGAASETGGGDTGTGDPATGGSGTGGSGAGGSGTGDGDPVGPGAGTDDPGTDSSGVGHRDPVDPGSGGPSTGDPDPAAPETDGAGRGDPDPVDRGGDPDGSDPGEAGPRPRGGGSGTGIGTRSGSGTGTGSGTGSGTGTGGSGWVGGAGLDQPASGYGAARPTVPTSSPHAATTRGRPMSGATAGAPDVVLADAPALQTVGADVRVAGGLGALFVATVFLGLLLYRRRARRTR